MGVVSLFPRRRGASVVLPVLVAAAALLMGFAGSAQADETLVACGSQPNLVFKLYPGGNSIQGGSTCPGGSILLLAEAGTFKGQNSIWQANAPTGLYIVSASALLSSGGVNAGSAGDYGGDFYWNTVTSNIVPGETSASFPNIYSTDFGFNLVCGKSTCTKYADISVAEVTLDVREIWYAATLNSPSGIWQSSGWIRGTWPLVLSGASPSGMCSLGATLAGEALPSSSSTPNPAAWHQCSAPAINEPVNTAQFPDGADGLEVDGSDAAGNAPQADKTVYIDNQAPTIALSGPSDASSSAGTQYVTAVASAGPSGVAGISCSVDGAPAQWYAASTAQVPVSGLGEHSVRCFSENNAVDASGVHGTSATQSFSMRIGVPTVAVVAFSKVADKLSCHRATERVRIPGRWVRVRVHGKTIRVRDRAHTERITVTRCHARSVRRKIKVWVTVRRHGKKIRVQREKTIRVLLEPHVVNKTKRQVAHGHGTTVDGWLGTTSGIALAGQSVDVLTAADNGRENFHVAAVATTQANGGWSARLPAGPSRLVTASYAGGPDTEGALSAAVSLIVPAKVELLSVSPQRVAWGGTVRLVGRLKGGYLPPGGALVRLRIGLGSSGLTYGIRSHVGGKGRFSTSYTFGLGDPATYRTYWFDVASLPEGNYPYAPATSRRLYITVGGDPEPAVRRPHRHSKS